jgi:putative flavoprotein involved in K+ transport
MPGTNTVIIGAGHAGLAMSRCLADRDVPHVVLDRGCVGERWRTARWDSFRLLTPNWLSRLPGWTYDGPDPDGFMTADEFVGYLSRYARSFNAPVHPNTLVTRVERMETEFSVRTDRGDWTARNIVVATGYHSRARVPELARGLAPDVAQLTTSAYHSPSSLPAGAVLVVGASASGVQIAYELAVAGRSVYLAVGSHSRLPRRYRGRDILWWLDRIGSLDRSIDEVPNHELAMAEPSLQLVGTPEGRQVDLGVLQEAGVRLVGRLSGLNGTDAEFADDLANTVGAAQSRLDRVLSDINQFADSVPGSAATTPDPPPRIRPRHSLSTLDLRLAGVSGVVWATGFQPCNPWLHLPILNGNGLLRHRRGVTDVAGLYGIGLRFQSRRNSTFIDGARHDAAYLADHISACRRVSVGVY